MKNKDKQDLKELYKKVEETNFLFDMNTFKRKNLSLNDYMYWVYKFAYPTFEKNNKKRK